jgi:Asp-tRNA(Asn)/Glu-tRNA(Gln) amidotransferase A subunit family amidase
VDVVFENNVVELKAAGASLVDPVVIPNLKDLLGKRANSPTSEEALRVWLARNPNSPIKTRADIQSSRLVDQIFPPTKAQQWKMPPEQVDLARWGEYLAARQQLLVNLMKVMADNRLDAIVHKSVEHQPTLIKDGMNPPYVTNKGVPTLNTFLVYVPSITVPSGFTSDNLPTGITFLGRPYADAEMIRLAYSYEQNTHRRRPPKTTPALH